MKKAGLEYFTTFEWADWNIFSVLNQIKSNSYAYIPLLKLATYSTSPIQASINNKDGKDIDNHLDISKTDSAYNSVAKSAGVGGVKSRQIQKTNRGKSSNTSNNSKSILTEMFKESIKNSIINKSSCYVYEPVTTSIPTSSSSCVISILSPQHLRNI